MPEGDTVYRTARTLRQALVGMVVTGAESTVPQVRALGVSRLVGQTVARVESRGKHLLVWFSPSDLALHTHLRMTGSWRVYRRDEPWRRPAHRARFVLRTEHVVAVCFGGTASGAGRAGALVCELLSAAQVERHASLSQLGPDALASPDLAEARRRLDARADTSIAEALLDQRVLAGIGNVYKSELLWLHAVDPWAPVGAVVPEKRDALLATAVELLEANVAPAATGRITTRRPAGGMTGQALYVTGQRLYVYGRARRPCNRCGTPIRAARQGAQARVTYWCPGCQGPGPRGP